MNNEYNCDDSLIDRIGNNTLSSSSVFLIVDCRLLLELVHLIARIILSIYSCLYKFLHPYFDAISPMLLLSLLQSHLIFSILAQ